MKRFVKLFSLIYLLIGINTNGQNFLISFAGTGATEEVATVSVENLSTHTSLSLNGSDILRLTIATAVKSAEDVQLSNIKIYPNPMMDFSTLEFTPPTCGYAVISVFDLMGKPLIKIETYLENLIHNFKISGLGDGYYVISVKGNNYQLTGKLICHGKSNNTINIEKIFRTPVGTLDNIKKATKPERSDTKGPNSIVDMIYAPGERLMFTGMSGMYKTVITDVPTEDKTITFLFVPCSDADNNNYPIIEIGAQTWMVANLKTTKYNDDELIPKVSNDDSWSSLSTPAYCWLNNDSIKDKEIYGALYNWYTINTSKLCPEGWHVPSYDDWVVLTNYLIDNGYGYEGSGIDIGKSLASQSGWAIDPTPGNVGNEQSSNNSSGFSAYPSGMRSFTGLFSDTGYGVAWWSDTGAGTNLGWVWGLEYDINSFFGDPTRTQNGFSVRCLKDY